MPVGVIVTLPPALVTSASLAPSAVPAALPAKMPSSSPLVAEVRGEALPSGHYVNEEAPEQVLDWFLRFFAT